MYITYQKKWTFVFHDIFKYKIKWNGHSKGRGKDAEGTKFSDMHFILTNRIYNLTITIVMLYVLIVE